MCKEVKDHTPELKSKIEGLLKHNQDALFFVCGYSEYAHLVDDLVDEPFNLERLQKTAAYANVLFSCPYWKMHGEKLRLLELTINLTYFDSAKWEKSNSDYLKREAKSLSHCGYNMLFAVLIIECGFDKTAEISAEFRESCHNLHKDDPLI